MGAEADSCTYAVFDGKPVFVHENFAREYNYRPEGALVSTYQELIKRRPVE